MSLHYLREAMSPTELLNNYPLPKEHAVLKKERDNEIKKVFTGESDKFLVIIGPCSADNEDSVCDYMNRLAKVQEKEHIRLMWVTIFMDQSTKTEANKPLIFINLQGLYIWKLMMFHSKIWFKSNYYY